MSTYGYKHTPLLKYLTPNFLRHKRLRILLFIYFSHLFHILLLLKCILISTSSPSWPIIGSNPSLFEGKSLWKWCKSNRNYNKSHCRHTYLVKTPDLLKLKAQIHLNCLNFVYKQFFNIIAIIYMKLSLFFIVNTRFVVIQIRNMQKKTNKMVEFCCKMSNYISFCPLPLVTVLFKQ